MDRRPFLKSVSLGLGALASPALLLSAAPPKRRKKCIKPKRLSKGDLVTLIAPGGPLTDTKIEQAVKNMEALGFKTKMSKHLRAQRGHMAGTDKQRLEDLQTAFSDKATKAVWCVRGGDGCNRLLPHLDYKMIKKNPKILIGFSDITALINAIFHKTGLIGFHGPVGLWELTDFNRSNLVAVLMEGKPLHTINGTEKTETLRGGKVSGKLVGGNLSLLTAMSGTPYDNDFKNKIVFIEDVGEKPRRIDRMLTQLRQANNLSKAKGVILGEFDGCDPAEGDNSLSLIDTLKDRLTDLNIPVLHNFPFGHDKNLCTFPIGIEAELDANNKTVTLKESAVI